MTRLRSAWRRFVAWWNADDVIGPDGVAERIPEVCPGCGVRRPDDPLRWELWEARHEECEPVGVEVPW